MSRSINTQKSHLFLTLTSWSPIYPPLALFEIIISKRHSFSCHPCTPYQITHSLLKSEIVHPQISYSIFVRPSKITRKILVLDVTLQWISDFSRSVTQSALGGLSLCCFTGPCRHDVTSCSNSKRYCLCLTGRKT